MMRPSLRASTFLLLALAIAPRALGAQGPAPRAALAARLDSIARDALARNRLAGLSVAVVLGRDTLLDGGYGFAEVGLGVPATPATTYRVLGPALAAAVMQQVERGRLKLDDDAARLIPEFPWQGKRVTVRQLMDASSGLPDLHYLGDVYLGAIGVPKAPDEVTALVAGKSFMHEPGASWQWTVSGFHLAGGLVERLAGQSWGDYLREHVYAPAGLKRTFHCDDRTITPGLARGYIAAPDGLRHAPLQSASMHPYIATTCTTAAEAVSLMRALRDGRLLKPESWRLMTTAEGTAKTAGGAHGARAIGLRINAEDGRRWVGEAYSLLSHSGAVLDFPEESLTVVALSNTSTQAPLRIGRDLARAVLGLPPLPVTSARPFPELAELAALPAAERGRYAGTYRTRLVDPAPHYRNYERTFRVLVHNDRLMIQPLGDDPTPLLHQGNHQFRSRIGRVTFTVEGGRAIAIEVQSDPMLMRGPAVPAR